MFHGFKVKRRQFTQYKGSLIFIFMQLALDSMTLHDPC